MSERRTTSVLFGDLVAFTTLSESRDPEEVRDLLSQYFAVARTVVGRYGGTIEKFIGDAVMAVWGVPISREDDAERAVRAGMELVAEVAALGASVGVPDLAMRVGVTTGWTAVTLGAVNEGMVAGDAVNTAARVQTAAEPGTVWVDHETRGLTAAAVAFSDMGEQVLKGKAEPVRLYRADAIVAAVGGVQRVDGLEAPMVGRDAELRQVKELFHATQGDGKARIAIVTGVAGVGKSRLGWEYEKYVDGISDSVKWHRGRCLSYGDGVAFWAFAEMMRSRLGLREDDDVEDIDRKVRAGVGAVAADRAEEEWLVTRVTALLRPADGTVHDRIDLFAAWTTFVERLGASGDPVVLLFEDTQYADSGLLDLVEHLLAVCSAGLFILVIARPELLERRPSLASGRRATVIDLQPLGEGEMTALVEALVGELPVKARQAVVARAEGVPLYAVETVRSLIDKEAVQSFDGRYVFVDHDNRLVDLDQLAAPTSLQMLIAARLDSLTPLERRTVQDASVLGMSFRRSGLLALADTSAYDLDTALASLIRKGVIETQDDPRSPERGSFRFLQAMVREVAYSTLARKDRRARHLAAADHLESEGEESAENLAGIISQHLVDSLEGFSPTDPERQAIAQRARRRLTTAAERAEALGSPGEALGSVLVALSLDPDEQESAALCSRGARTAYAAGAPARAEELALRAASEHEQLGQPEGVVDALVQRIKALIALGRSEEAGALVRRGQAFVDQHPEIPLETQIDLESVLFQNARAAADSAEMGRSVLQMTRLAERQHDPAVLVHALNSLAVWLYDAGAWSACRAVLEHCIVVSRDEHLLLELGRSLNNVANSHYPYDLPSSVTLTREAVDCTKRAGQAYYTEGAMVTAAHVWWLSGAWDLVATEIGSWLLEHEVTGSSGVLQLERLQVEIARGTDLTPLELVESSYPQERLASALVWAMQLPAGADLRPHAASVAAAAKAAFSEDSVFEDFEVVWAPAVELQLRVGDLHTAEELLGLADPLLTNARPRALLGAEMARLWGLLAVAREEDPEQHLRAAISAHEAYQAPYLAAQSQLALASWLLGQGRGSEARELLEPARATFARLGARPAVEETERALNAVADRVPVIA